MNTRLESSSAIPLAVEYFRAGELVAFPTETVYGLGADARRDAAVRKIYDAKDRPLTNPTIVHAANTKMAQRCVETFPHLAEKLAERFWPGPLTLVLPRAQAISPAVSAGRSTIAIRVPRHPVALELLAAFDGPIAAPSANRSGFVSPTTAAHVLAELDGRVGLILDGGACDIGVESTVLDLTRQPPLILRPGGITAEMLRPVIGDVELFTGTVKQGESAPSPGLLDRHYAPQTRALRFTPGEWPKMQAMAQTLGPVALISHDAAIHLPAPHTTILLSRDESAYARSLYSALRAADAAQAKLILVLAPPASTGLWAAIADRLHRATVSS